MFQGISPRQTQESGQRGRASSNALSASGPAPSPQPEPGNPSEPKESPGKKTPEPGAQVTDDAKLKDVFGDEVV